MARSAKKPVYKNATCKRHRRKPGQVRRMQALLDSLDPLPPASWEVIYEDQDGVEQCIQLHQVGCLSVLTVCGQNLTGHI